MKEIVIRFVIGGAVVSVFAALGEVFRPKSFAGLFGAAPSIALSTLGLTIAHDGKAYAALEARSMIAGALAFFLYAAAVGWILMRYKPSALTASVALLRFLFGGVCTVAAGVLAWRFGPRIGGLFLAFPAIFPAGASLIEKHERQHKRRIGCDGTNRGRAAASIDAAGASLGCLGLTAFALVIWRVLPQHDP